MKHVFFIHERKRFVIEDEENGKPIHIYKEVVTRIYKQQPLEMDTLEDTYEENWHRIPGHEAEYLRISPDDLPILLEGITKFLNRSAMK